MTQQFVILGWDVAAQEYCITPIKVPNTPEEIAVAATERMACLRAMRDQKLQRCDWTQLPDVSLTPEKVEEWRTYRQQLRDYMGTVTDPFNPPAWPVPPAP